MLVKGHFRWRASGFAWFLAHYSCVLDIMCFKLYILVLHLNCFGKALMCNFKFRIFFICVVYPFYSFDCTRPTVSKSNECLASSYQGCFHIPQPRFQNTLEMKSIVLIWCPPPLLFVISSFPETFRDPYKYREWGKKEMREKSVWPVPACSAFFNQTGSRKWCHWVTNRMQWL